jgi:predicted DNA-binding transcriptional regulator YafY
VSPAGAPGAFAPPPAGRVAAAFADRNPAADARLARIAVLPGRASLLRVRAEKQEDDAVPSVGGRDVIVVGFSDLEAFSGELAALGGAGIVLDPPDLRDAVVRRLRSVLAAHEGAAG